MRNIKYKLIILLACIALCVGTCNAADAGEFSWWDLGFTKMTPITINDPLSTDYPLLINVPWENGMRVDFGDIRFATWDGDTEIAYFINDYIESESANIYVKLPANTSKIAMYWKNSTAATTGSGSSVFYLYDDFEDSTLNTTLWTNNGLTSCYITGGALRTTGAENSWDNFDSAVIANISDISGAFVAETHLIYTKTRNNDMVQGYSYLATESSSFHTGLHDMDGVTESYAGYLASINETIYASGQSTRPYSGEMVLKTIRYENDTVEIYENGNLRLSQVCADDITDFRFVTTRYSKNGAQVLNWQYVVVKPYTDSEPTITWGVVESIVTIPDFTVQTIYEYDGSHYEAAEKPVYFTDNSTGIVSGWNWDFGDGATSTEQNPIHTYTTPGQYNVTLNVSSGAEYSDITKENIVTIFCAIPVANFTTNKTTVYVGENIEFADYSIITSDYNYKQWVWNFGDGDVEFFDHLTYTQNVTHAYNQSGNYTVTLVVYNEAYDFDEDYFGIYISNVTVIDLPPTADFVVDDDTPDINQSVQFTDNSTGIIDEWLWDFGDGTTSIEQNPIHSYTESGFYTIMLTVVNTGGNSTETKTNFVKVGYSSPVANFTTNITGIVPNMPIQFTDTSTGTISEWNWDFGDGATSIEQNPVHTYSDPGVYTVSLNASNILEYDVNTKTDYINVANDIPVAEFVANTTVRFVGENIEFSSLSTGVISDYWWNFGDGSTSTEQNPTHSYTESGFYTIMLTVSNDAAGINPDWVGTVTKTNYIIVLDLPPTAAFSVNSTYAEIGVPIQFTDESTGMNINEWLWDFGDGATSTEQNPVYAYPTFGTYTVRLTVSNDGGDHMEEKVGLILVHNATPVINDFTASVLESEYPVSIHFTPDITGTVHDYYWDFGDGTGSSTSNPDHTYTYAGWFTVELNAANDGGQDAMTKTTYIRILSYYPTCDWATSFGGDRTLRFIDHSYVGEFDEPITEYSWDFGDGATSTEKNPVHFYPSIGQGDPFHNYFDVTHGVKNARGWTYTTATVDVHNDPNWVPVKPESGSMSFLWLPYNDLYLSEFISQNPLDDTVEIDNVGLVATCIMWLQAHTAQMGVLIASLIVVTVLTLKTQSVFALFLSMSLIVSHMTTSWCPEEAKFLLWVILAISLVGIILKPIVGRN